MTDFTSFMPHSAEAVQMFAILLFLFFYRKKSLEGEKVNTTVTKVKAGRAPDPDGFDTDFCFNKEYFLFRIAYFQSGLRHTLLFRGNCCHSQS